MGCVNVPAEPLLFAQAGESSMTRSTLMPAEAAAFTISSVADQSNDDALDG